MLFPSSAAPAPPPPSPIPASPPIARYLGGVALNDQVHTFFDHLDVPGTRFLQAEQLLDRDGEVEVIRVDRKALVMTCYLVYKEAGDSLFRVWARQLEDATVGGVDLVTGEGDKYVGCYASEIIGTQVGKGAPFGRTYRVSFKVNSPLTEPVPV